MTAPKPRYVWQGKRADGSTVAERMLALLVLGGLVVGLGAYFISWILWPPAPPRTLAVAWFVDTGQAQVPPLFGRDYDQQTLAECFTECVDPNFQMISTGLDELQRRLADPAIHSQDAIVLYLSGQAWVDGDEPVLLTDGFDPFDDLSALPNVETPTDPQNNQDSASPRSGTLPLKAVLEAMRQSSAGTKLLLIDAGDLVADPAFFRAPANSLELLRRVDFAGSLKKQVESLQDPALQVVVSHQNGERSHHRVRLVGKTAIDQPGTLFASAVITALREGTSPDLPPMTTDRLSSRIAELPGQQLPPAYTQRPQVIGGTDTSRLLPLLTQKSPAAAPEEEKAQPPKADDPAAPLPTAEELDTAISAELVRMGITNETLLLIDEIDRIRSNLSLRSEANPGLVSPIDYAPHWWRVWNVDRARALGPRRDLMRLRSIRDALIALNNTDAVSTEYTWERELRSVRESLARDISTESRRRIDAPLERRARAALLAIDDLRYRCRDHVALTLTLAEVLPITFQDELDALITKLANCADWPAAEQASIEALEREWVALRQAEAAWSDAVIAWSYTIGRKAQELPGRWGVVRDEAVEILLASPQTLVVDALAPVDRDGTLDRRTLLAAILGLTEPSATLNVPADDDLVSAFRFETAQQTLRLAAEANVLRNPAALDVPLVALEPRNWGRYQKIPPTQSTHWWSRLAMRVPAETIPVRLGLVESGRPLVGANIDLNVDPFAPWTSNFQMELSGRPEAEALLEFRRFPFEHVMLEWSENQGASWNAVTESSNEPVRIRLVEGRNRIDLRARAECYRTDKAARTFDGGIAMRVRLAADAELVDAPQALELEARAQLPELPTLAWHLFDSDLSTAMAQQPQFPETPVIDQQGQLRYSETSAELRLLPNVPVSLSSTLRSSFPGELKVEVFGLTPDSPVAQAELAWGRHDRLDPKVKEKWRSWLFGPRTLPLPAGLSPIASAQSATGAANAELPLVWTSSQPAPMPAVAAPGAPLVEAPPVQVRSDQGLVVVISDASGAYRWICWYELRLLRPDEFLSLKSAATETTSAAIEARFDPSVIQSWTKAVGYGLKWEGSDPALPPALLAELAVNARLPFPEWEQDTSYLQVGEWSRAFVFDEQLRMYDPAPTALGLQILPGAVEDPIDIQTEIDGEATVYTRRNAVVLELLADRPAEDDFRGEKLALWMDEASDSPFFTSNTARFQRANAICSPEGLLQITVIARPQERIQRTLEPNGQRRFHARSGAVEESITVRHDATAPEVRANGVRVFQGDQRLTETVITIGAVLRYDLWVKDDAAGVDPQSVKVAIGETTVDLLPEPDVEEGYRLFRGLIETKDWVRANYALKPVLADRLGNQADLRPLTLVARPAAETGDATVALPPMPLPANVALTLPLQLNGLPFAWSRVDKFEVDGKPHAFEGIDESSQTFTFDDVAPGATIELVVTGKTRVNRDVVVGTVRWTLPKDNIKPQVAAELPVVLKTK